MIETGDERNVTSYMISGTVFSAVFAGSMNYSKFKKDQITKDEMIQDTAKMAIQGGIGAASAVATANYIGSGNYIGAMMAIAGGAMGIYGTQMISEVVEKKIKINKIEDE